LNAQVMLSLSQSIGLPRPRFVCLIVSWWNMKFTSENSNQFLWCHSNKLMMMKSFNVDGENEAQFYLNKWPRNASEWNRKQ
jgi:hypothetical protein